MDTSLHEKLRSLGVQRGPGHLKPPRPKGPDIEQVIAGRLAETPHGPCFVTEQTLPLSHVQGCAPLDALLAQSPLVVAQIGRDAALADFDARRAAFLDTETTGLAGGTGTYAFLVGVGQFIDDAFRVQQFFMRGPHEELALLAALQDAWADCQTVVTFNGKAFDLPLLQTRLAFHRQPLMITSVPHLDVLHLARRLWKERLKTCALASLEAHVLGVARQASDVPSWMIPSLYFDYLRSGDARPLAGVFYHNVQDIASTAALAGLACAAFAAPFDGAIVHGEDWYALGKWYEELGLDDKAEAAYRRALAEPLVPAYRDAVLERLSFLCKRRARWSDAVELWKASLDSAHLYPYVELAKYYEHRAGDFAEAEKMTRAALAWMRSPACDYPPARRRVLVAELEHRLRRVQRRRGERAVAPG